MHSWQVPASMAILVWGVWGFVSKLATKHLSPHAVVVFQGLGNVLIALAVAASVRKSLSIHPVGTSLAVLGGICGLGGTLLFLRAIAVGDAVVVVPFTAMYPLVTVVLCAVFLREPLTGAHILGIILALAAVALLST